MKLESAVTMLFVALLATTVSAQESTRKDFEEYCQAMEGRWVGELTLVADWPGLGKKGDKITAYSENTITADGNALSQRFYAGDGKGEGMTVFDAGAKQIKGMTVSSGGSVFNMVAFKKDGKWGQITTGSNPDGSEIKTTATLAISDNGATHTWTRSVTVGGEKMEERSTSWHRVSK